MSNLLHGSKQQQVVALGRLGWSLRRIEAATGVRRETISGYLTAAGVPVCRCPEVFASVVPKASTPALR